MSYTEHTVTLPDGIHLYYTDSGTPHPDTQDHSTWIIQNGLSINANSFVHLHPLAKRRNLRLVVVNRRGYPGSSDFSEEEKQDLVTGQKHALDKFALHNAWLIELLIDKGGVSEQGGVVLVSWSLGNATTLSLFADPDAIPHQLYTKISPYLKAYILHDPPNAALGYPLLDLDCVYRPYSDPDYASQGIIALARNHAHWNSSYFKHPDPQNDIYDSTKRTERRSVRGWTEQEWEDRVNTGEADVPICCEPMLSTLRTQTANALFNPQIAETWFPDVKFGYISSKHSIPDCVWMYRVHKEAYEDAVKRGERIRQTKFTFLDYANHFVHYDFPEKFLDEVLNLIR